MELNNLKDLYSEELLDLYASEEQLIEIFPTLIDRATQPALKNAFSSHLKETGNQRDRLVAILRELDTDPAGETCESMESLINELQEMFQSDGNSDIIDAGLINAAKKIEHHEISGYQSVISYAEQLGDVATAELLRQSLNEEMKAEESLTQLSLGRPGREAAS